MNTVILTCVASLLIFAISTTAVDVPCILRPINITTGRFVCVCNSLLCDTIEQPRKLSQPLFLKYTSSILGLRFVKLIGRFEKGSFEAGTEIIIDPSQRYQTIIGWGGAFTDATGINIKSLPQRAQDNLLRSYFSEDGLEYSLGRVPIGGTDFSTRSYSYDDGEEDLTLANFQLAPEDFNYKIPLIKEAQKLAKGRLNLFASAWTAPKWMKTNGAQSGIFGFLRKETYQTWADYFLRFLDEYQSNGLQFWGITTGNEPSLSLVPFNKINSVAWTPSTQSEWISQNLGPTLRNSTHSDIKIMAIDDQRFFLPWFVEGLFKDNATRSYVDGIGVHWYQDWITPASLLTKTHNKFPDKFILGTEACAGSDSISSITKNHVILGSWTRGEQYANDIIEDLSNWVGGWTDWNMALDLEGGPTYVGNNVDSPIIVNATAGEFYKQPTYYALGHFAKFIPRNSVRIGSSSSDRNVKVISAQRPDNATVVVILNKKLSDAPATIVDSTRGIIKLTLSPKSITTIIYW